MPRAPRRPPRPRAWPRCGEPSTSPPRTWWPTPSASASSSSSHGQRRLGLLHGALQPRLLADAVLRRAVGLELGRPGLRGGGTRLGAVARRWSRRRRRRGRRQAHRLALLAHARVLRPAADVGAQRVVLDGDGARADRVEQRAVVGDEQQRAREGLQRVLERLAGLEVEVVRRLVEDQHVGAGLDEDGQRQAPALAAAEPVERLVDLLAAEQEAPEQRARLVGRQAGALRGGLEHGARAAALELLGVLAEVADLHVVAGAQPAAVELAPPDERLDERRLARAVGPDERDVLAALEPQLGVGEQDARRIGADLDAGVLELEDHAPRALGLLERELEAAAVTRVALDALDLVELLDARLGLARLGRLVAEALDEALHALDLGLLLLDRPAERHLARGLLAAPRVPGAVEEARAAGLELEHRGADRLQEPAVVGDEDDGRVEVEQRLLEPLERLDVEVVGGLVEQQQVGLRGQRPGQRGARELPAGERSQGAVEVVVDEAEAVDDRARPLAPAVAADGLEARLHAGVAVHGLLVAGGHRELQALELGLELQRLAGAREHVFPQAEVALARRALVVQGDARALREDELAAVDRRSLRPASAAGSSCPRRCARRSSCARGARA